MSKIFQSFKKKIGNTIIVMGLIASMTITVNAQTLNQTTANLNMREGASTSTKVIQVIQKGENVEVIKKDGKWSQVCYNGKTGYVYNRYLSKTTEKTGIVKVGNSRLNVRNKASMSSKIIGKLYTGNKVEIKGESGSWYKINYKGKTAYISKKYVKVSSTIITEVEECGDYFKAQIQFNVRTGPSTSYTKIGKILKGQVLQVQGKCSNGWYQIQYGSKTGYISSKYLDEMEDGAKDPAVIGTAKVDTKSKSDPYLAVREGQGINTTKLDDAKTGVTLEILEDSNSVKNWTKVRYNNLTGYSYNKWLIIDQSEEKPEIKDEAPVITSEDEIKITVGNILDNTYLNIKVMDKEDGDITDKAVIDTSKVDINKVGEYEIKITVKDSFGNEVTKTVKVIVKEKEVEKNEVPVIAANDVTINIGEAFTETMLNAKAEDKEDGNITDKLTIDTSKVDTSKVGTYDVILTVTDSKGEKITKTVKVTVKATKPVISASDVTITEGDTLNDSEFKASAKDCEGTNLDVKIDKSKVDTSKVGTYTVTVSATDKWNNTETKIVTVAVVKNELPTITADDITINVGDTFNETMLNAKAEDKEDGNITDKLTIDTSKVDTSKVGTYEVILTVTDSKGEKITKTVKVTVKATKPVINALDVTITEGDTLNDSEFKANAKDCEGTNLDVKIDTSKVDTSKVGTYIVTLSATDKWGNTATNTVNLTVKEKQKYAVNSTECRAIVQKEMYRLVNEHRANNGRTAYTISSLMQNTAWEKSKDMGENNYFDHEYNGKMIWEYKDCADADGENIALCGYNAKDGKMTEEQCKDIASILFNMWKESAGHNANMLSKVNKSIGFDLYLVDKGNDAYIVYATQEFRITNE